MRLHLGPIVFFFMLLSVGCRDGAFEKRQLGSEQVALSIVPLESQRISGCSDKPNCHRLQVNFDVKSRDGTLLTDEKLTLTALHEDRVISPPTTSVVDERGVASFVLDFREYPHENGLRFLTQFILSSESWGSYSFCALVEPSLNLGPIHSFKPCDSNKFKSVVFGDLQNYDISVHDVVVLNVQQSSGPLREAILRATMSIRDLNLIQPATSLPISWKVQLPDRVVEGSTETSSSGQFEIDFAFPFSPFKNEKNEVVFFEVAPLALPEKKMAGYFLLNFDQGNIRPLVASGRGEPPSSIYPASDQSDTVQKISLIASPLVGKESAWELDENLRLILQSAYDFKATILLSRTRLASVPEQISLAGNRVIGKCFLVNGANNEIAYELAFETTIDSKSQLALQLFPTFYNFARSQMNLRAFITLSLPDFDEVPTAYFEVASSGESKEISRTAAEKVLRDRLLVWEESPSSAPPTTTDKNNLFRDFLNISTLDDGILPKANRDAILEKLSRDRYSKDPAVWSEIFELANPHLKKEDRKKINTSYLFKNLRVREIFFVKEVESVHFEGLATPNFSSRLRGGTQFNTFQYTFRIKGKSERCVSIALPSDLAPQGKKGFFECGRDVETFDLLDRWYVFEGVDNNPAAFLLKEPLPTDLSLENLKLQDLFHKKTPTHPQLLDRLLWPPASD